MPRSSFRPVKVAKRSGFDKSHFNLLPAKVGTEVPVLVDEVIGNTSVYCRLSLGASMPPLATDTYMSCDIKLEAFYVPFRVLYGGFESFYLQCRVPFINESGTLVVPENSSGNRVRNETTVMPRMNISGAALREPAAAGYLGSLSLFDYLGGKTPNSILSGDEIVDIQPLPFIAYHMIMNHYYRNKDVETEYFARTSFYDIAADETAYMCATMPYSIYVKPTTAQTFGAATGLIPVESFASKRIKLADGKTIFDLRQRSFGYDYFTNAYPQPQFGDAVSVDSSQGYISIASLRAGNTLQEFKEQRLYPGNDYAQALKADFNANLANGVADRPILLGSLTFNVYNKTVEVTATNSIPDNDSNPFSGRAGGVIGNGRAAGQDVIISGFTAQEPGYIFILAALVPKATYSTGVRRYLRRYTSGTPGAITEMARSSMQSVGNQPIYQWELTGNLETGANTSGIFAYTDRFADFMEFPSEIHGNFKLGGDLQAFAAQRAFTGSPQYSSEFLKIPTNYLDNVTLVSDELSTYGYWMEIMFDYKVSMPLAEYSVPSLVDPGKEHGDTVMIHRGGFKF